MLYVRTPKGYFPQDDTGLIFGGTRSLDRHLVPGHVRPAAAARPRSCWPIRRSPASAPRSAPPAGAPRSIAAAVHQPQAALRARRCRRAGGGQSPAAEAPPTSAGMRGLHGCRRRMCASAAAPASSQYQFTLWGAEYRGAAALGAARARRASSSCRGWSTSPPTASRAACRSTSSIDRVAASRLGVRVQDIDNALNNAFAQRQISTIYTQRNQYRVILEIDPQYQRDPTDLARIYVRGADGRRCRCRA